jgi:hypothetical protein
MNMAANTDTTPSVIGTLKHPSAFLPIVMSILALAIVIFHIAMYGTAREPDEGTSAHLWQLLTAGQIPIIAYFAIRWLAQAPRSALPVLALQAAAGLAAMAPVYLLHW